MPSVKKPIISSALEILFRNSIGNISEFVIFSGTQIFQNIFIIVRGTFVIVCIGSYVRLFCILSVSTAGHQYVEFIVVSCISLKSVPIRMEI